MDMGKTLPRQITNNELEQRGGSYTGIVRGVAMERKWNKFTREKEEQPVISFTDGYELIPNMGMRRDLIAELGCESDDWLGTQITVCQKWFTFIDKETGEEKERPERYISDCRDTEDAPS
jgi:hypothetical protein